MIFKSAFFSLLLLLVPLSAQAEGREIAVAREKPKHICMNRLDGTLKVRERCSARYETKLSYSALIGDKGEKGDQGDPGPTGSTGPTGQDGSIRIYGDGTAGVLHISSSQTFSEPNPQFTNVLIDSGATLTVPSGTVIRCTGSFTNNGTILVLPGLRDAPRFAENGRLQAAAESSPTEALGGEGGVKLSTGIAKQLLRLGLLTAGSGYRERADTGGDGGGSFSIICKDSILNSGTIQANGSSTSLPFRGGGGGGFIVLASMGSITHSGVIEAKGGNGGALLATDANSTGYGPGGGGGGGIVHLFAPEISNTGTVTLSGGTGGSAGGAGSITGFVYFGGGGGGSSGGSGGRGGTVNTGNSGTNAVSAAQNGEAGQLITTEGDPTYLF